MRRKLLASALMLTLTSAVHGANVEIVLDAGGGPYAPGAEIAIDIRIRARPTARGGDPDIPCLRIAQFDFSSSDPALSLDGFAWELESLPGPGLEGLYLLSSDFPTPRVDYVGVTCAGTFSLPGSFTSIATVFVSLPVAPGVYAIDAIDLSANSQGQGTGAFFQTGFGQDEQDYENFPGAPNPVLHTPVELCVGSACDDPDVPDATDAPSVSAWGMIVLALMLMAGLAVKSRSGRRTIG